MGSVLFLGSWAVLMGPVQYMQHLISGPRLPFTAAYFGSIALTLVFAVKVSLEVHPSPSLKFVDVILDRLLHTLLLSVVATLETVC